MWKLVKVQSLNYLRYMIPLMIFLVYYFTQYHNGGKLPVFIFLCFWAFMLVSGSLSTSESYEEKNNGYRILSVLPVTAGEIVAAKFILILGSVMVVTGLNIILLLLKNENPGKTGLMVMIGLLWGVCCLIYGAVMYIGIFKWGFASTSKYFWLTFLVLLIGMIFILGDLFNAGLKKELGMAVRIADSYLWLFAVAAGGMLYFYLYKLAVRIKGTGEGD